MRDAQADRAGREIDVVGVLGARRIGLRAFVAAEVLELFAALAAEQILDGVKVRRGMRLDRDAVGRPQRVEIKRGHDGRERGRRRLMPADLHAIAVLPHMIGMMNGPRRKPQHLALKLGKNGRIRRAQAGCVRTRRHLRHRAPNPYSSTVSKSAGMMISRSSQSSE